MISKSEIRKDKRVMNNYITTYKGINLYLVKYDEFVQLYEKNIAKDGYIISDKKNAVIINGQVIGYTIENHRKMMPAQGKKSWQEVFHYVKPKPKVEVISERPTVEAMTAEGNQRLKAVLDEAPVAQASAEVKLNELVAEGNKAVEKVIAEGETIRKAMAVAETPVKRKRTNPSSRKRASV
jgi:hypothetical protein